LTDHPITVGWREWVDLPDLGLFDIKAKVDTGARTSALHAFEVEEFFEDGRRRVRFLMHPRHRSDDVVQECFADVVDRRTVTNSGGGREERYVISTRLRMADEEWPIEMTLTARDDMMFRMLLGRTAMNGRIVVDPARSYLTGKRGAS
jgi:hypothetical protein